MAVNLAGLFHPDQVTIGMLLAALHECGSERRVAFDFCDHAPNGIHPLAMVDGDLALGHAALHEAQRPTVQRLVDVLYGAINQKWTTRQGHEFKASGDTRLWVGDMNSDVTRTVITGLQNRFSAIYLTTALHAIDD